MDRNDSAANHMTFAPASAGRRSIAGTYAGLALRCLRGIAHSYSQSSAYNPYWIGAGPLPGFGREERRG